MTHALFAHAVYFASVAHASQKRKGDGLPYDRHCFEVAKILTEHGVDTNSVLAAAVLHDVVEDTEVTVSQIENNFGSLVAFLVQQVTNDANKTRSQRKREQLNKVVSSSLSEEALWIKLADAISNVRDMDATKWSEKRKAGYAAWKLFMAFHTGRGTAYSSSITQSLTLTLDRAASPYVRKMIESTGKTLKQLCEEHIESA